MYDFETTSVILNLRIYWGDRSEFWNAYNMTRTLPWARSRWNDMKITKTDRKNRGMDLDAITDLLNRAPVGRVATVSTDGTPYVVPVNFAFEGDRIYFHCALEGMKLDYISANPKVGFETRH